MNVFDTFSIYSGLKPNKSKCKIAGISALKGVSLELCGMECIDLTKNSVKILGIHFSYNKKIENEENFIKIIKKIENVLKIWRIRNLTIQGKITIFKTFTIIHLALVTNASQVIIDQLNKIFCFFFLCLICSSSSPSESDDGSELAFPSSDCLPFLSLFPLALAVERLFSTILLVRFLNMDISVFAKSWKLLLTHVCKSGCSCCF